MVVVARRARVLSIEHRALLAVVGAIILWTASTLFVRAGHSDALVFTTWRLWFALPPLASIMWIRSRLGTPAPFWPAGVPKRRWVGLLAGGGAFFVSGAATAFAALGMTRLLDVTLIGALQPIVIIAFAVTFLDEALPQRQALRAVIAVGGTMVVAGAASGSGSWSLAGDVIAVVSLFLNAGWFLYGRVLRTNYVIDPIAFMFGTLFSGAIILTPIAWIAHGDLHMSPQGYFFAACTMVSGTTAHVLMIWAHRFVPTAISSPLLLGEPPLVAIGAWIFFAEAVSPLEAIGSVIVVVALWGIVRGSVLAHLERETIDPEPPT